jgi:hypothetical protein
LLTFSDICAQQPRFGLQKPWHAALREPAERQGGERFVCCRLFFERGFQKFHRFGFSKLFRPR